MLKAAGAVEVCHRRDRLDGYGCGALPLVTCAEMLSAMCLAHLACKGPHRSLTKKQEKGRRS